MIPTMIHETTATATTAAIIDRIVNRGGSCCMWIDYLPTEAVLA
jgi:hypothetical protein